MLTITNYYSLVVVVVVNIIYTKVNHSILEHYSISIQLILNNFVINYTSELVLLEAYLYALDLDLGSLP